MKKFILLLLVQSLFLEGLLTINLNAQTRSETEELAYAEKLFSEELYDLAAIQFTRFANAYPASPKAPQALLQALKSYYRFGKPQEAIKTGREILLIYPETVFLDQTLQQMAEVHLSINQFMEAARDFGNR